MNVATSTRSVEDTKEKIEELLDTLSHDNLVMVQRFIEFLHERTRQGQPIVTKAEDEKPPYLYPTIENPASSLDAWLDLIPGGCGGDALADTEALYDEV
jgi:hypothetical protein